MFHHHLRLALAALAVIGAATSETAAAALTIFTGSAQNQSVPAAPSASCAPLPLLVSFGPGGTSGSSNFGAFTYTQRHCTAGPGPYGGGRFEFLFEDDMFSGNYSGTLTPTATPGFLNNQISFVIEQGTGRFAGATGIINGTGTLDARLAEPLARLDLNGTLGLAVPEPSTWAMLITGFGLVGGMMRVRGRRQVATGQPSPS